MNDNNLEDIEDLTYRVNLLREQLEKGKIKLGLGARVGPR